MEGIRGYNSYAATFKELALRNSDMPIESVIAAFGRTSASAGFTANPYVQNRRVKAISSLPVQYEYDSVAEMIQAPDENELPLRQVSHVLESTVAPYWKIRKTYQDIMTYHWYTCPTGDLTMDDAKTNEFKRELSLTEKFVDAAKIEQKAHEIVGQCVQEGKVFYTTRYQVDKTHNQVNYAFMQQLPQDWLKIVGFNNISKYTVAFNLMYFMEPGTSTMFFGDLFTPYMDTFWDVVATLPLKNKSKKFVFAAKNGFPGDYVEKIKGLKDTAEGAPDIYYQMGKWYYWVMLPVDRVWTFEIDDINRNVVPPLTGLFLSLVNIAKYEQIQLSLVQNPLVSLVLAEIPYRDDPGATQDDAYRLSPAGRTLFEEYWRQMLYNTNTTGVGFYSGPFKNMHLEQLAEAPSATKISSDGYSYAMQKSGIGIIPSTTDPRAGTVNVALKIECRFGENIYRQMENMMNYIFFDLGLKYDWKFHMFGNLAEDDNRLKNAKEGMTLGILSSTLEYLALLGRRVSDDLCASNMIMASGIMDLRQPLVSTYSARQDDDRLPSRSRSQTDSTKATVEKMLNPGGRERVEVIESEGKEQDADQGK